MQIKRSEIKNIVMLCPYCGTEQSDEYGFCCGESHFEENIDTGEEYFPLDEVEIIEDVPEQPKHKPKHKMMTLGEFLETVNMKRK